MDGRRRIPRALVAILVAGAALRLLFVFAWQPAFMGWPDAASYIDVSQVEPLEGRAQRTTLMFRSPVPKAP